MGLTAGPFLAAAGQLPLLAADGLAALAPVIVLAPHPDDESLACGGLLAQLAARALPVRVVAVSDGAASHPGSRAWPPARLQELRAAELEGALAELGLPAASLRRLDLPDGGVPRAGTPRFPAALDRLQAACAGIVPRTLVTSWRHDPHTDHAATFELAVGLRARWSPAPTLLEYVVWGWHLRPETPVHAAPPHGFRLDPGPALERKRRAIAAHGSQLGRVVTDDPNGFALEPEMVEGLAVRPELFLEMPA